MQQSQQQFRQDEIVTMVHWDKQIGVQVTTPYPKIGGRLRIAHEQNEHLSITSQVISYDGDVAVVSATTTTDKGTYNGVGMASVERDKKIAPAILELAESRAIARSLRFCGIGVEYCGAEEISHLSNLESDAEPRELPPASHNASLKSFPTTKRQVASQVSNGPRNGNNSDSGGRLSNKQLVFIMRLATARGLTKSELDAHCIKVFGVAVNYLSGKEASTIIEEFNQPVMEAHHG